jgi:hypothetical protein
MIVFYACLSMLAAILLPLVGRPVLTEWIVKRVGEDWFAPPDTLEGCSTVLASVFLCGFVVTGSLVRLGHGPAPLYHNVLPLIVAPIVVWIGTVAYSLIWLYSAASGMRGKQFFIDVDTIRIRRDSSVFEPIWVEEDARLVQSSAFHGCILYALTLRDKDGRSALNGYSSQEEYLDDKAAVLIASGCTFMEWRARRDGKAG